MQCNGDATHHIILHCKWCLHREVYEEAGALSLLVAESSFVAALSAWLAALSAALCQDLGTRLS